MGRGTQDWQLVIVKFSDSRIPARKKTCGLMHLTLCRAWPFQTRVWSECKSDLEWVLSSWGWRPWHHEQAFQLLLFSSTQWCASQHARSFSASAFQQYSVVCFSASCTLFCIDTCRIVLELRLEHLPFLDTASVEISEHAEKARICWKAWFSGLKSHQHVVDFCWAAAEFVMHVQRTQFKTNLDLQCVNICQWFARCHYAL